MRDENIASINHGEILLLYDLILWGIWLLSQWAMRISVGRRRKIAKFAEFNGRSEGICSENKKYIV